MHERQDVYDASTATMLHEHPAEALPLAACLEMLLTKTVGRIVYTVDALPAVAVVPYVVDGMHLLLRCDANPLLVEAVNGSVVAFEVDDVDPAHDSGWMVVVVGFAHVRPADVHTVEFDVRASLVTGRTTAPFDASEPRDLRPVCATADRPSVDL